MAGSKPKLLTYEQAKIVGERYPHMTNAELSEWIRRELGVSLTAKQLAMWGKRYGYRKTSEVISKTRSKNGHHVYTDEMKQFLREYVPGRLYDEVNDEFEHRFGWRMSRSQYKNIKIKLGVRAGVPGGRFVKGQVPPNKGKTWDEIGYSPELQAKLRKNTYHRGHVPANRYHKILDMRTDPDGITYIYVKPRNAKYQIRNWIPYSRFVWMQHNGRDFPDDCRCVHANHDASDFSPENLVAVPNEIYGIITGKAKSHALDYWDRESLELAMLHARLMRKRTEIERKRPRKCVVCGKTFVPSGKRQRYGERVQTCDECRAKNLRAPIKKRNEVNSVGIEDS